MKKYLPLSIAFGLSTISLAATLAEGNVSRVAGPESRGTVYAESAQSVADNNLYASEDFIVTTEPTSKNVVLEEFTGIHCGNCPDGHEYAARILSAMPGKVFPISVHAGYYAEPATGEPDFRTPQGSEIDAEFCQMGYPSACINRQAVYDPDIVESISRSDWTAAARTETLTTAPLNLAVITDYEPITRDISIRVEGYVTSDAYTEGYLTVMVAENNIPGPQGGAPGYGSDPQNYNHMHLLRAVPTEEAWGEKINLTKGEYFSREYVYNVPQEDANGIRMLPENMEVVAFVAESKVNILQAAYSHVQHESFVMEDMVDFRPPFIPTDGTYGYNFFEARINNRSNNVYTSVGMELEIDGKTVPLEWTGEIGPFQEVEMRMPYDMGDLRGQQCDFSMTLKSLNGKEVPAQSFSGSMVAWRSVTPNAKVVIKPNQWGAENTFTLRDMDGTLLQELGTYENGDYEERSFELSLEPNKQYCLEVTDEWGDGILSPRGYLKLYGEDGKLAAQLSTIEGFGARLFFSTTDGAAVSELDAEGGPYDVYDLQGRLLYENIFDVTDSGLKPGLYIANSREGSYTILIK